MATSPQIGIRQFFQLNKDGIVTLNSAPFKILDAPDTGYYYVFNAATVSFRSAVAMGNVDNVLGIYGGTSYTYLLSNLFPADNLLGVIPSGSGDFLAANPYATTGTNMNGQPIYLKLSGSNPTGGDSTSVLTVSIMYDILAV